MSDNQKKTSALTITIIVLLLLCCCCVFTLGTTIGGYYLFKELPLKQLDLVPSVDPTATDDFFNNSQGAPEADATPAPLNKISASEIDLAPLKTLEQEVVPENDPLGLACRLKNICNIPTVVPSGPYKVGDNLKFWLTNTDTVKSFQIDATLQYLTPHAYFWVENDVDFDMKQAKALVNEFENKMYPTDREFFGSEANPGIDGDPHIYIVYGRGIGSSIAGYFSSPDEYAPAAHEYSNAHEMFVFNADNSPLDDTYTYGVLAHEFQHMIHFVTDRNEESWINEGFSEVAVQLNGYYGGGADQLYIMNPDMQLNDWSPDPGSNGPHYGASFLFLSYFLDRFGEDATKAVVSDAQNGFDSIENVLNTFNITDGITGKKIGADDVFQDWTVTNYLLDSNVADGRYNYKAYANPTKVDNLNLVTDCPTSVDGNVHQYGADYIEIRCGGDHTLVFDGDTATKLLPENPASGKKAFWSNKGDESDMTLTHEFDLTGVTGEVNLNFKTWYDLEQDYDYLFLEASTDDGKTWEIIKTPSGTDTNPSGNSYGWGYNGSTKAWLNESVDISSFAGKKVLLRFEYITDAAVNGEGFMVDDVSIPQIDYATDFETDDGGWVGDGFINVENILPQTFRVTIIDQNGQTTVTPVTLDANQYAEIQLDTSDVVVIVSGTTRHTRSLANYRISIK